RPSREPLPGPARKRVFRAVRQQRAAGARDTRRRGASLRHPARPDDAGLERLGAARRASRRFALRRHPAARHLGVHGRSRAARPGPPSRRLHPQAVSHQGPARSDRAPLRRQEPGGERIAHRSASRFSALLLALSFLACARTPGRDAAATAPGSGRDVVADLPARLVRWKPVAMPFAMEKLAPRERLLVEELMEACSRPEAIFWRPSDPEGGARHEKRPAAKDPSAAVCRGFLWLTGGGWDLLDGNRPFVGRDPMPPGHWLYPKDLTRAEIESYVAAHPDERKDIYGERTVIARREGRLAAIPYREAYRDLLTQAATALREAAEFSDGDPAFARFLRMRADALLSDDYYASDVAWLELVDPKFDLILAPYETYMDELLGVKGSFGAAVLVRDDAESEKLAVFRKY